MRLGQRNIVKDPHPLPRIVDLTLPLKPGMRGVATEPKFTVARDGWNASTYHLYSHAGTHMDAPIHFGAGPGTIDQIEPAQCMGLAWVIPLSGVAPKALIETDCLGRIAEVFQPGESLLLRTDWSRFLDDPLLYRDQLPRIGERLARWCVERKVKLLGVEPPSVADVNNLEEVTRIHRILLGGGVTIVEGLTGLKELREPKVFFVALPLKVEGGDGSPVRAFAMEGLPEDDGLTGIFHK
jgi:kynurenine formamidase